MARYDKYDPVSGGFRAALRDDLAATTETGDGNPLAVTLDANGAVVAAGDVNENTSLKGVVVTTRQMRAGDIVDVMTDGDIVEVATIGAGTDVYADMTNGSLTDNPDGGGAAASGEGVYVGHTVEAGRLVVRVAR